MEELISRIGEKAGVPQEAARQAVSAALTFSALKYVCEQHIKQCIHVSQQLALPAPAARPK